MSSQSTEPVLVTNREIDNIRTEMDIFRLPKHIKCEDEEHFRKIVRLFGQLHISTSSNAKKLTVVG